MIPTLTLPLGVAFVLGAFGLAATYNGFRIADPGDLTLGVVLILLAWGVATYL